MDWSAGAFNHSPVPRRGLRDPSLSTPVLALGHLLSQVLARAMPAPTVSMSVAYQAARGLRFLSIVTTPLIQDLANTELFRAPLAGRAVEPLCLSAQHSLWKLDQHVAECKRPRQQETPQHPCSWHHRCRWGSFHCLPLQQSAVSVLLTTLGSAPAYLVLAIWLPSSALVLTSFWATDESDRLLAPSGLAPPLSPETQCSSAPRVGSSSSHSPLPDPHWGPFMEHYGHQD